MRLRWTPAIAALRWWVGLDPYGDVRPVDLTPRLMARLFRMGWQTRFWRGHYLRRRWR